MTRKQGNRSTTRPDNEGRARCWRAMRVFGTFVIPQVCMAAEVSLDNASNYIRALRRAGYVNLKKPHLNGKAGSYDIWTLVRDSGPHAPIWRTDGTVFDPNTKRLYKLVTHDSAAS